MIEKDYLFYKSESLVGIFAVLITVIFTLFMYNKEIYWFMVCLSWYIIFSEIYMIINMWKCKKNGD